MSFDKILSKKNKSSHVKEDYWIPLSDLMTGLMMIFMLIAISYMIKMEDETKKIKNVAIIYDEMRVQLYDELNVEFKQDLIKWDAQLDTNLMIRFKNPNVLFDTGQASLKPKFTEILDNFFPRYIKILSSKKYKDSIEEVRIEGHTSSVWSVSTPENQAYFLNMELSQSRTRSVLQHILLLPQIEKHQQWLKEHLTANGLSSSKILYDLHGQENKEGSQRVEFIVRTNADARIADILKTVQP